MKEWWQKPRTCLKCGAAMSPGNLPGWFNCTHCKLWIDIQLLCEGNSLIHYNKGMSPSLPVSVPQGTLLVMAGDEA
jgi:hypothetical protein